MTNFQLAVRLAFVSDAETGIIDEKVAVVLAGAPVPIGICIANPDFDRNLPGDTDQERCNAVMSLMSKLPVADGWSFEIRTPGHKIDEGTGKWEETKEATLLVLTKNGVPYRQPIPFRKARYVVEYEVGVKV
jgi:hypothetical protein